MIAQPVELPSSGTAGGDRVALRDEKSLQGERRAFVGTAGWNIPAQYGSEFCAAGSHLERYATRLNAVEINSSFYRAHRLQTYERWACSVPSDFRFSVKVPKEITHERRLVKCQEPLARFASEVSGLGAQLGALLVQLPPSLEFDAACANEFFDALAARIDKHVGVASEPRHRSWFTTEADALMRAHKVARVAADPPPSPESGQPGGWTELNYYRLHGAAQIYYSNYEAAALERLRGELAASCARARATWCIFDNTAAFAALGNALTLGARCAL